MLSNVNINYKNDNFTVYPSTTATGTGV
jgi:hypothetical protein